MTTFGNISKAMLMTTLAACCMSAVGATISGTVRLDRNHDGWPSQSDPGIPNMLVSDGFNFAVTDENGRYSLPLHEKAQTIYVQRTEQYTADITRFWHRVTPGRQTYDFLLEDARPVTGDTLSMVIIGDAETHDLSYMETIRTYIANHPEINLFINAGDISAGSPAGMEAHRDFVNAATMGMPVIYACGNHDEDFRGRGFYGATDPFLAIYGPWWESFEMGGYLFVVVPIYNSWGAPILYDMLDCGDWLKALCKRFPDKKKILIGHDLPDLVGYKMASHSGDVVLDDEKFVCAIYAHKHMNIVKKYPSGRKSFCVATPNKGGSGVFSPSFRVLRIDRKTDKTQSELFYPNALRHLALITPQNGMSLDKNNGHVTITADAYDGGDEIVAVTASHDGQSINLSRVNSAAWHGEANWKLTDANRITLSATTKSGKEFSQEFDVAKQNNNRLAWLAQLPADIAICDLTLVKGLLIIGVSDDENAEKGGLYALKADTGEIVWSYTTGYGIRNNVATDGDRIYAIDTRANIHAVDVTTGKRVWINPSDPSIVSPSASAIVCHDGIVAGGYGRHLRGIRAADGETIWRNTSWQVEERTPAEDKLAVADGSVFIISRLNGLYRHDLKTGKVIWQYKNLFANATALPDGDAIWLIPNNYHLFRLDLATGKLLKDISFPCYATTAVPVKLPNGLLLVASGNKGLGAVDPATGKEAWRFIPKNSITPTADYTTGNPPSVTATPLIDSDNLWVAANDGILYKLDPQDGHVIESHVVGMPVLNRPCADAQRIYVSDCFGRIMAIEK
jgi:outer membrane protein assembly factor BamB